MKYFMIFIWLIILGCNSNSEKIYSTVNARNTSKPIELSKKITVNELKYRLFNLEDLRLLRNEIYARKGYIFKSADLDDYFSQFEWYIPKYGQKEIESNLSDIDRSNIETILYYESQLKESLKKDSKHKEISKSSSFLDLLDYLPEIILPFSDSGRNDCSIMWSDYTKQFSEELKNKYTVFYSAFAKITVNDNLIVIGECHPGDIYNYIIFSIYDSTGSRLDEFKLEPSPKSSYDFYEFEDEIDYTEETITFNNYILTDNYRLIRKTWIENIERDTLGNILKDTFSDTIHGDREISEITRFMN